MLTIISLSVDCRDDQMIGVTEPRRVAARSMSERVAKEMNLSHDIVSYQMRFEGNVTPSTKIKFMTDGVLLKEFQSDHLLSKYSAIVIDEAHERSVFSDLLIGVLSRVIDLRSKKCEARIKRQESDVDKSKLGIKVRNEEKPLKLIIMSATLRVEDFTENLRLIKRLVAPPPVLKIEGRMFDVTIHYNKKTEDDYVDAAYNKVCKIHRQLPEGAILVFLTGQNEIFSLIRKLNVTFPSTTREGKDTPAISAFKAHKDKLKNRRKKQKETSKKTVEDKTLEEEENESVSITKKLLDVNVEDFVSAASVFPDHEGDDADLLEDNYDDIADGRGGQGGSDDDFELDDETEESRVTSGLPSKKGSSSGGVEQPLYVLPLFSQLESCEQIKVFQPPPPGTRLCVIATNVAETSLTIPDVKYVVDSGKTKDKIFDKVTGVSMFHVTNCSQASANQRAGRAGRVAPGHCYRLFSSAVFNEFLKFDKPEILCRPIDDIVLILKNLKMPVVNFPYPTPPDYVQVSERTTLMIPSLTAK